MDCLSRVLRQCGYNHSSYVAEILHFKNDGVTPLDPVPADLPGSALIYKLRSNEATPFAWGLVDRAVDILSSEEGMESILLQDRVAQLHRHRHCVFTSERYAEHWRDLKEANLMEEVPLESICYFSTYFAVPKTADASRAIFNGKSLSEIFERPPPVNLLDAPRLLKKIEAWHRQENGRIFMLNGDLRHWFHAIPNHKKNRKWFGLRMKNASQAVRWMTLAMGWSWSPHLAQCIGYGFLAYRESEEARLVDDSGLNDPNLPHFLPLLDAEGVECGFVTLYYDNYIVVSNNEQVAKDMQERIRVNSDRLHIVIKENSSGFFTPDDLRDGVVEHLGVEMSTDPLTNRLRWRIVDKAKDDTTQVCPPLRTPREAAAVIGRCLYGHILSLEPLASRPEATELIQVLRTLGKLSHRKGWDCKLVPDTADGLDEAQAACLHHAWDNLMERPFYCVKEEVHLSPEDYINVLLATDACDKAWGYVCMSDDGRLRNIHERHGSCGASFELPPHLQDGPTQKHHIYFKEMHAMCQGLIDLMDHAEITGDILRVNLIIDNVATLAAWRNGYSSTEVGTKELLRVYRHPGYKKHAIQAFGIPGNLNVADVPSRMKPGKKLHSYSRVSRAEWVRDFDNRKNSTLLVYHGLTSGRFVRDQSNVHSDFRAARVNLRHPEPVDVFNDGAIEEELLI